MPPQLTFDVERFEWTSGDRLEVAGRWFGLRGERFIRPTLDVAVDGRSRRLLALMEHKPWAAEDGEEWVAAFAWEGERGDIAAELSVGSGLVLELPPPGGMGKALPSRPPEPERPEKSNGRAPAPRSQARRAASGGALTTKAGRERGERAIAALEAARAEAHAAQAEIDVLRRRLEGRDRTVERLETELRQAVERAESAEGSARQGTDEIVMERDAAAAARDAALAHAEEAQRREYEARGALAAAERECQAALKARDEAVRERDAALAGASPAASGLDAALRERDAWIRERDAALRQRDAAIRERDEALGRVGEVKRERDVARVAYDAAQAERPVTPPGPVKAWSLRMPSFLRVTGESPEDERKWVLRMIALGAFAAVCLIVAVSFALAF